MNNAAIRLVICTVLFALWIALVIFQVPGDEQIIDVIKYTLAMLGGYHAGDRINTQALALPPEVPALISNPVPPAKEST
jgi:hypothetical protein